MRTFRDAGDCLADLPRADTEAEQLRAERDEALDALAAVRPYAQTGLRLDVSREGFERDPEPVKQMDAILRKAGRIA